MQKFVLKASEPCKNITRNRCNRPLARSGHMVQNHTCWGASCAVGLPKQRQVQVDWYKLHCFGSLIVQLLTSMCDFVPCDRIVQMDYYLCKSMPVQELSARSMTLSLLDSHLSITTLESEHTDCFCELTMSKTSMFLRNDSPDCSSHHKHYVY